MSMALSMIQWLSLLAALVLFMGPGFGLLSFHPDRRRFDKTQTVAVSFGLSIALWSVLLAWMQGLRVALSPAAVLMILLAGWAIGLIRIRPSKWPKQIGSAFKAWRGNSRVVLWSALILTVVAGIWALQGTVVGPGSDSYHHTLITQMIVERGMLPDDYQPYAPIATFTYHFGFHGMAAALSWLTGLTPVTLVPLLAQILMAAAALAVAFFTEVTTRRRSAAMLAAVVTGLVSVFPAYYINWGRYTQLTGLILLPIFLGLIWDWIESGTSRSLLPFLAILAAGLALTHYRVTLMAASGVIVLSGGSLLLRKALWPAWKEAGWRLLKATAIAGGLTGPWIWHLFAARQQGYPVYVGPPGPTFFTLERLGSGVLNYPTNILVAGLTLMALLWGWWRRERLVMTLSTWAALMLFLSTPRFAGAFMDTISVFISLYFPASVIIGWALATSIDALAKRFNFVLRVAWIGLAGVIIWGAATISSIVEPGSAYVQADDLAAMEWIRQNTPPSARFMVNTFHWDYLDSYVIGSDAGYWLPLLANRAAVVVPMVYPSELSTVPDLAERIVALDRLNGHLTSLEALALLRQEGITHVYIGQRGGPLSEAEMESTSHFKLAYTNRSVYIFEFVAAPAQS
ncbi:MAG TPA: DUF6541 family protein [Anaerolineae bacterium]|nr:DUF6541 family protein [Anaerolineae bacterium]